MYNALVKETMRKSYSFNYFLFTMFFTHNSIKKLFFDTRCYDRRKKLDPGHQSCNFFPRAET